MPSEINVTNTNPAEYYTYYTNYRISNLNINKTPIEKIIQDPNIVDRPVKYQDTLTLKYDTLLNNIKNNIQFDNISYPRIIRGRYHNTYHLPSLCESNTTIQETFELLYRNSAHQFFSPVNNRADYTNQPVFEDLNNNIEEYLKKVDSIEIKSNIVSTIKQRIGNSLSLTPIDMLENRATDAYLNWLYNKHLYKSIDLKTVYLNRGHGKFCNVFNLIKDPLRGLDPAIIIYTTFITLKRGVEINYY